MKAFFEVPAASAAGLASSFSLTEKLDEAPRLRHRDHDEHKQADILTSGIA
jgi:hypothetical protein